MRTRTGFPFCVAGLNQGRLFTTLTASLITPHRYLSLPQPGISNHLSRRRTGHRHAPLHPPVAPATDTLFLSLYERGTRYSAFEFGLSLHYGEYFLFRLSTYFSSLHANTITSTAHNTDRSASFHGLTLFACCFIAFNRFRIRPS